MENIDEQKDIDIEKLLSNNIVFSNETKTCESDIKTGGDKRKRDTEGNNNDGLNNKRKKINMNDNIFNLNVNKALACNIVNTSNLMYYIKLAYIPESKTDSGILLKGIISKRQKNPKNVPGLVYTYLKMGNYQNIPLYIIPSDTSGKNVWEGKLKLNPLFDRALNSNNVKIYLISMVNQKNSMFGDHNNLLIIFTMINNENRAENYWISTGAGYDNENDQNYFIYEYDSNYYEKFKLKSIKNYNIYANDVRIIDSPESKMNLKNNILNFLKNNPNEKNVDNMNATYKQTKKFGRGILPGNKYEFYTTCSRNDRGNCASYVQRILSSSDNKIGSELNISGIFNRLVGTVLSIPNKGTLIGDSLASTVFGAPIIKMEDEEKIKEEVEKYRNKAIKMNIKNFVEEVIEFISNYLDNIKVNKNPNIGFNIYNKIENAFINNSYNKLLFIENKTQGRVSRSSNNVEILENQYIFKKTIFKLFLSTNYGIIKLAKESGILKSEEIFDSEDFDYGIIFSLIKDMWLLYKNNKAIFNINHDNNNTNSMDIVGGKKKKSRHMRNTKRNKRNRKQYTRKKKNERNKKKHKKTKRKHVKRRKKNTKRN